MPADEYAANDLELPKIASLWDYADAALSESRFRETLVQAQRMPDRPATRAYILQLKTQLARSLGKQDKFAAADEILDEVAAELKTASDVVRVRYLLERGRVRNSSGEVEAARPLFVEAWELARNCGEENFAVDAAHMVAITLRDDEALEWNETALALAESATDPTAKNWCGTLYNNIGWTYQDDYQQYEKALEIFERAVKWREERSQRRETLIGRWCVARTLRSLGRNEDAFAMQQALQAEHAQDDTSDGFVEEELAELYLLAGDPEAAQPVSAEAHRRLSSDAWFARNEPARLERLQRIARGEIT